MEKRLVLIENGRGRLTISCDEEKHGDVYVVCLHGLQSNRQMFAPLAGIASKKGLSFLAIDFVGYGDSDKPADFSYALEDQAAVVTQVLKQVQPKKFFLIGHSLGGMVGIMLLKEWEKQLLGFVNMEGNFTLKDCGSSVPAATAGFAEFSHTLYPNIKGSLTHSREPSAADRGRWLESVPDYAFHKTSQSIVDWSESEKLLPLFTESPVRKLFVYGEYNSRKKDVLPADTECAEIPDAGHFMMADNPEATVKAIEDFLS